MFGQIIIGLANSGKSTFCQTIGNYLTKEDRKVKYVNLDPGAETIPYKYDIDIRELVCVDQVMSEEELGSNGSLVLAMKVFLDNISWLDMKFSQLPTDSYLIIDFPGQIELYTQVDVVPKIISHYTNPKTFNYRLTTVFLVESFYCMYPSAYISILITKLITMLQLVSPQVNVLTKSKQLPRKKLSFDIESYLKVDNLQYLLETFSETKSKRFKKLYQKLVDTIVDLPWFGFSLYDYQDDDSIKEVMSQIDSANGYIVTQKFISLSQNNSDLEKEIDKAADELVDKFF